MDFYEEMKMNQIYPDSTVVGLLLKGLLHSRSTELLLIEMQCVCQSVGFRQIAE
jgi:hypothetical protein